MNNPNANINNANANINNANAANLLNLALNTDCNSNPLNNNGNYNT